MRLQTFLMVVFGILYLLWDIKSDAEIVHYPQKLTVREEPDRVVLAWSGEVSKRMRDEIAAAIDTFKGDKRRLVISLNSPGGVIGDGRDVMEVIRKSSHLGPIDTHVEKGSVCASMCVPIYLLGNTRTADAGAYFMFHLASLDMSKLERLGKINPDAFLPIRQTLEKLATDDLFNRDIGVQRVSTQWLMGMRLKIADKERWVTAQQLMDERSGVVDALVTRKVM